MGSDSRDCSGCDIDGLTKGGQRSDTTILIHLSGDRKRAYGVSIPRDSIVNRPGLQAGGRPVPGGEHEMWNAAYSVGGPACTIEQVEQPTGMRIDNYVVVDFGGFKDMVDAVDGVEVCVPAGHGTPRAHGITSRPAPARSRGKRRSTTSGSGTGRARRQRPGPDQAAAGVHRLDDHKVISSGTLTSPTGWSGSSTPRPSR